MEIPVRSLISSSNASRLTPSFLAAWVDSETHGFQALALEDAAGVGWVVHGHG